MRPARALLTAAGILLFYLDALGGLRKRLVAKHLGEACAVYIFTNCPIAPRRNFQYTYRSGVGGDATNFAGY